MVKKRKISNLLELLLVPIKARLRGSTPLRLTIAAAEKMEEIAPDHVTVDHVSIEIGKEAEVESEEARGDMKLDEVLVVIEVAREIEAASVTDEIIMEVLLHQC